MGKVLTINRKIDFSVEIADVEKTATKVKMNGLNEEAETKVFPQGTAMLDYYKFNIEFHKKYNIVGKVNNREFTSILRKYTIPIYVKDSYDYVYSIDYSKGTVVRAALKRLRKATKIKCTPVQINLTKAISCIKRNLKGVEVVSGWFANLGEQLQNALLQGKEVNENSDWKKFLETVGSELKNVEFKLEGKEYARGYIIFSLSSRGFIHIKSTIGDTKLIKIAERIVEVLDRDKIIEYENVQDEEEKEKTLYFD